MNPLPTVALLAALQDELQPAIARLSLLRVGEFHEASLAGVRIVAAVSGIGRDRALAITTKLIQTHQPRMLVHLGFAGALDPALAAGQVIHFTQVINEAGEALSLAQATTQQASVKLLTLDRIADSASVKRELFAKHAAAAVDMETFHVAREAARLGVPMIALRAISDTADMAVPAAAADWVKPDGSSDASKAVSYLASRPWLLPTLMTLRKHTKLASAALADHVQHWLESQPFAAPDASQRGSDQP